MPTRRHVLTLGAAVLSAPVSASCPAFAQSRYPDRPIRLVIPYPPGGVNDAIGRPWAEKMKSSLGTVVVENLGGGGGTVGASAVVRAQPDGYTILLANNSILVVNPIATTRKIYDPIKDFEPIALLIVNCLAFAVHPSLPVGTLQELIDYAKNNPGKLSYGSAGIGTGNHLTAELFKSLTGTADIVHVPYRGAGPAISDLIGGQIPMAVAVVTGQVIGLHASGKLRMLAVTGERRLVAAPDVPTAVEAGVPGMVSQGFQSLFAPVGTPLPIIEQISRATRAAMADDDMQRLMIASGFEPQRDTDPEKTRRFVAAEIARWAPIIKGIGLKLD